jgi:hypothetical protein
VKKLEANKAWLANPQGEAPDLLYTADSYGTFAVGVKVGNGYLDKLSGSSKFITQVPQGKLAETLDMLIEALKAGELDSRIAEALAANKPRKGSQPKEGQARRSSDVVLCYSKEK